MTWNDHDHLGDYAEAGHDHYDYAERHHRHHDLENDDEKAQRRITGLQDEIDGLRTELADALERIAELERIVSVNGDTLDNVRNRVYVLEHGTPEARQLQYEADLAAAGLAESGYDRHGRDCQCSYCAVDEPEPVEYDPGPECDDQGGMSERPYLVTLEDPWLS
jgi:hypothetical protein